MDTIWEGTPSDGVADFWCSQYVAMPSCVLCQSQTQRVVLPETWTLRKDTNVQNISNHDNQNPQPQLQQLDAQGMCVLVCVGQTAHSPSLFPRLLSVHTTLFLAVLVSSRLLDPQSCTLHDHTHAMRGSRPRSFSSLKKPLITPTNLRGSGAWCRRSTRSLAPHRQRGTGGEVLG